MAITENSFTAEELKAAIEANQELAGVMTSVLPERGFVIRSKEENETFLKNYESEVIAKKTNEFAQNIEKDVLELTGIAKKTPDQKYYDYLKTAVGEKLGTVKQMETELTELKKKQSAGEGNNEDKTRIKDLELALSKQKEDHQKEILEKETKLTQYKARNEVEKIMSPFRATYKPNLPKVAVEAVEKQIFADLIPNLVFTDDGKILIKDAEGNTLKDPKLLEPVTLESYLSAQLSELVDEGKKAAGAGSGKGDDKDKDKGGTKFTGVPSNVETKVQLSEYLYKLGITDENPEYLKIMEEHGKNLRLK